MLSSVSSRMDFADLRQSFELRIMGGIFVLRSVLGLREEGLELEMLSETVREGDLMRIFSDVEDDEELVLDD